LLEAINLIRKIFFVSVGRLSFQAHNYIRKKTIINNMQVSTDVEFLNNVYIIFQMIIKEVWVIFCVILWNINGRIGENITQCNIIDINQEELERMNIKEQEEYVKKTI
jgi:hypothetical protein